MPTTTITIRAEVQHAQREIQGLRQTQSQLNRTIVENQNALLNATGEERRRIQAVQAANRVQAAAIRQQISEIQVRRQAIAELQREGKAREQAARAAEGATEQSRQATQQLAAGVAISAGLAARELGRGDNVGSIGHTFSARRTDIQLTDRAGMLIDLHDRSAKTGTPHRCLCLQGRYVSLH